MEQRIWVNWRIIFYIRHSKLFQIYINKNHETVTDNTPIRIYVSKIGSRVTFEIKIGHYLELLTPETIKLLRITESEISKIEMGNMFLV